MVQSIHGKDRQIQERNGYSNIKDAQIGVSHPSEWLFIRFFIELDEEGQGNQGKNQVEVFVRKLLFFKVKIKRPRMVPKLFKGSIPSNPESL